MKTRAKWGSLKAFLCSLKPGDSFAEPDYTRRRTVYCTAQRAGIKIHISQPDGLRAKGRLGFIATIVT